jgi:hypothetical protein
MSYFADSISIGKFSNAWLGIWFNRRSERLSCVTSGASAEKPTAKRFGAKAPNRSPLAEASSIAMMSFRTNRSSRA